MHDIESATLRSQDLNLLVVLDVLLQTRSVTGAGRALGLSPSATSHALGRLRDAFDDALLVRTRHGMVPTPRATALQASLQRVLDDARGLYRRRAGFEARQSTRRFVLAASDLAAPLIPQVFAAIRVEAPRIALSVVEQLGRDESDPLMSGQVDLSLQPTVGGSGRRHAPLGRLDFVVVARPDHPFLSSPTLAAWCAQPHIQVSTGRPGVGYVGRAVERAGHARQVALTVPTFLLALHTVAATDLLYTAPRALVAPVVDALGLGLAPVPLGVPAVPVAAVWHQRFDDDPANRWFRQRVIATLRPALSGNEP